VELTHAALAARQLRVAPDGGLEALRYGTRHGRLGDVARQARTRPVLGGNSHRPTNAASDRGNTPAVVARLGGRLFAQLRAALPITSPVRATTSWAEFVVVVRTAPADVAVVDPCIEPGPHGLEAVRFVRRATPDMPIVLYAPLTGDTAYAMLDLAECGVRHHVLERFDDSPERLRTMVETARCHGLEDRVLHAVLPALYCDDTPVRVADAVRQLMRFPLTVPDQRALAQLAGVSLRHLNRSFERLELAPAGTWLLAARVLRAYQQLQHPQRTVLEVAAGLGYSDPRDFAAHAKALTGVRPSAWRTMPSSDVVDALLARLRRGGSDVLRYRRRLAPSK
jgi:AraC-like DNA-binding protein